MKPKRFKYFKYVNGTGFAIMDMQLHRAYGSRETEQQAKELTHYLNQQTNETLQTK